MLKSVECGAQLNNNEAGITRLVEGLFSLLDGEMAVAALIGEGNRAIPALRRVLLEGKPSTVYLPRQRIVRTLGEIGAFSVLREYLQEERQISDSVLRLAEEAVENTAARELGHCHSDENLDLLLRLVMSRRLPGAVEALTEFRRPEAAPAFVAALESDFCRNAAIDGIRQIYNAAIPHLIESVRSPEPSRKEESPTSLRRRRSAARLLAEQETTGHNWSSLEFLLYERDEWLQSCGAELGFLANRSEDALRILLTHLNSKDWVLVDEIARCLRQHCHLVEGHIRRETEVTSNSASVQDERRCRLLRWVVGPATIPSEGEDIVA
jgi:phosphoglycolate phosphatase-like HAD superfamily hydrolase